LKHKEKDPNQDEPAAATEKKDTPLAKKIRHHEEEQADGAGSSLKSPTEGAEKRG